MAEQGDKQQGDTQQDNEQRAQGDGSQGEGQEQAARSDDGMDAREVVRRATEWLTEVIGQPPEAVIGVAPDDGGWHVTAELLELARVPDSTDVLGQYEVDLDADGQPRGYRRVRRYPRSYVGEDI